MARESINEKRIVKGASDGIKKLITGMGIPASGLDELERVWCWPSVLG